MGSRYFEIYSVTKGSGRRFLHKASGVTAECVRI